ncbi:glycosyltransferase family 1 protein [Microbacterium sp. BWT-B31]|uniref:glycosyltransferase family 4 protein n=1 Tax=Microbacterium sp. BWT-B31 TaxID=3232072 RepID=UPI0035294CE0
MVLGPLLPRERVELLADVLGKPTSTGRASRAVLADLIDPADRSQVWLAASVVSGELHDDQTIIRLAREAELDPDAFDRSVASLLPPGPLGGLRVVSGPVLVDVSHTVSNDYVTGIQRVVRETVGRWLKTHDDVLPVAWTAGFTAMRRLTTHEAARLGIVDRTLSENADRAEIIVPWQTPIIVPELAAEAIRAKRMRAVGRFSGNPVGTIVHDLVPLVASETTVVGMPDEFARYLSALRHNRRIAAVSHSVADEHEGWKAGLTAIGVTGPEIVGVPLPLHAGTVSQKSWRAAEERLRVGSLPMVLVVGSHEPRKNHLPILEAASRLWEEGLEFSLAFIGGGAWGGDDFTVRARGLMDAGMPLDIVSGVSDGFIWAAYRLARFTMFPSFYEGFGLPVAESLASGTPCITSGFGSMKENAEGGGALLVDAYSDDDIRDKMRLLLTDDALLQRLRAEAAARSLRTWDDYATDLWEQLVMPLRADRPERSA